MRGCLSHDPYWGPDPQPRHTCVHVHNTAQRLVLWRKLSQDESLGISVRGGAVWPVVPEGLSREITFTTTPAGKGSQAEGAASAGKKRGGMLNWLRVTPVSSQHRG